MAQDQNQEIGALNGKKNAITHPVSQIPGYATASASTLEQVANLLCAQANSASYPRRDGK